MQCWIYESEHKANLALADIDANMGFSGDTTRTWAEPREITQGDFEGMWFIPSPPPTVNVDPPQHIEMYTGAWFSAPEDPLA